MVLHRLIVVFAICLANSLGCGGDGRVDVYPVSGKVTVKGQPAAGAKVIFYSQNAELQTPGIPIPEGTVAEDGSYRLKSYKDGDGAPAGDYAVTVVWNQVIEAAADPESVVERDRLAGRYASPDQSGLKASVKEVENQLPPFELQ